MALSHAGHAQLMVLRAGADTESESKGGGLHYEVELWRVDLAASVVEVDRDGRVLVPEHEELGSLYPGGLVLGVPPSALPDAHVSALLPDMAQRAVKDLFTAGALGGAALPTSGRRSLVGGPPEQQAARVAKRGAMKSTIPTGGRDHQLDPAHAFHVGLQADSVPAIK
jgi:hypothetical protein